MEEKNQTSPKAEDSNVEVSHFEQTPPTAPTSEVPKSKSRIVKFILFALVFLVAIFVLLIGYNVATLALGLRNVDDNYIPKLAPLKEQPSPTPNLTSNWKTYTNSHYGFSIKYPNDYTIHTIDETDTDTNTPLHLRFVNDLDIQQMNKDDEECAQKFSKGAATCDPKTPPIRQFELYIDQNTSSTITLEDYIKKQVKPDTISNFTINEQAIVKAVKNQPGGSTSYLIKNSSNNNINWFIIFDILDKPEYTKSLDVTIMKILSTFKFTNQVTTISPTPIVCPTQPTCKPGENLIHGEPDVTHGDYCASYVCMN